MPQPIFNTAAAVATLGDASLELGDIDAAATACARPRALDGQATLAQARLADLQ